MKNKLVRWILITAMILISATMCGCSIGMDSLDDIIEKNDLKAQITYYGNGGWFNGSTEICSRNIYYKENSKAFEITADSEKITVQREAYVYAGWYTVKTVDSDGVKHFVCDVTADQVADYIVDGNAVITQKDGNYLITISDYDKLVTAVNVPPLVLDQPFDFSQTKLAKGDRFYLAAAWLKAQMIEYVLVTEDCTSITINNPAADPNNAEIPATVTYNNGDVVGSELFDYNGKYTVPTDYNLSPLKYGNTYVKATDATFVDYYYSEDGNYANAVRLADVKTELIRPEEGNVTVFVKYVAGSWTVIREAKDVKRIFATSGKYYVSRDIDCANESAINTVSGVNRATIRGNGHKISNLKAQATGLTSGGKAALFGTMTNNTIITDLTFKDISLTYTTRKRNAGSVSFIKAYLLNGDLRENEKPTLTDFTLDGLTFNITLEEGYGIENMPHDGTEYATDEWLYKGYKNDAFNAEFETFNLVNYKLIINGATVATDIAA